VPDAVDFAVLDKDTFAIAFSTEIEIVEIDPAEIKGNFKTTFTHECKIVSQGQGDSLFFNNHEGKVWQWNWKTDEHPIPLLSEPFIDFDVDWHDVVTYDF